MSNKTRHYRAGALEGAALVLLLAGLLSAQSTQQQGSQSDSQGQRRIDTSQVGISSFLDPFGRVHLDSGPYIDDEEKQQWDKEFKKDPQNEEQFLKSIEDDRRKARGYRQNPERLRAELLSSVAEMRDRDKPNREDFYASRSELEDKLTWLESNQVAVSSATSNEVAENILDIYDRRRTFSNQPDDMPIVLAAKYGRSQRVKEYIRSVLFGTDVHSRVFMLTELASTRNLKNDADLFEMLKRLYDQEGGGSGANSSAILATLCRIDGAKGLPVLLQQIDTTADVGHFIEAEYPLSEYNRTDLLDHVFRRLNDFPATPYYAPTSPLLGLEPRLIAQYIDEAEGDRLELGLTALGQSYAVRDSYILMEKKLKSSNVSTRRVAAKYLESLHNDVFQVSTTTIHELESLANTETDQETKGHLQNMVARVKREQSAKPNHE